MTPLESARSGALCELCKKSLDLDVNFCPWCGFPVQERFEAGTLQCATKSKVWRQKKAKSVVQLLLLAFFTGIYSTSKKQSLSESALKSIDCPKGPDTVSLLNAPFVREVGRAQLRRAGAR